jgi:hypothetical protein
METSNVHYGCSRPWPQHCVTLVRNHAQGIPDCDFFVGVTASFRVLYVLVIIELGTRGLAYCSVTAHATAD